MGKRLNYSATFKFKMVRELLTGDQTEADVLRQHPRPQRTPDHAQRRFHEKKLALKSKSSHPIT